MLGWIAYLGRFECDCLIMYGILEWSNSAGVVFGKVKPYT